MSDSTTMNPLLIDGIIETIFFYISFSTYGIFQRVCRRWNKVVKNYPRFVIDRYLRYHHWNNVMTFPNGAKHGAEVCYEKKGTVKHRFNTLVRNRSGEVNKYITWQYGKPNGVTINYQSRKVNLFTGWYACERIQQTFIDGIMQGVQLILSENEIVCSMQMVHGRIHGNVYIDTYAHAAHDFVSTNATYMCGDILQNINVMPRQSSRYKHLIIRDGIVKNSRGISCKEFNATMECMDVCIVRGVF